MNADTLCTILTKVGGSRITFHILEKGALLTLKANMAYSPFVIPTSVSIFTAFSDYVAGRNYFIKKMLSGPYFFHFIRQRGLLEVII